MKSFPPRAVRMCVIAVLCAVNSSRGQSGPDRFREELQNRMVATLEYPPGTSPAARSEVEAVVRATIGRDPLKPGVLRLAQDEEASSLVLAAKTWVASTEREYVEQLIRYRLAKICWQVEFLKQFPPPTAAEASSIREAVRSLFADVALAVKTAGVGEKAGLTPNEGDALVKQWAERVDDGLTRERLAFSKRRLRRAEEVKLDEVRLDLTKRIQDAAAEVRAPGGHAPREAVLAEILDFCEKRIRRALYAADETQFDIERWSPDFREEQRRLGELQRKYAGSILATSKPAPPGR